MLAMIGARARQRAAAERQQAQEGGLVRLASPADTPRHVSLVVSGSPALVGVGLWEIFRSGPCHVDEERDRALARAAEEHSQTINGCNVAIPWGRRSHGPPTSSRRGWHVQTYLDAGRLVVRQVSGSHLSPEGYRFPGTPAQIIHGPLARR